MSSREAILARACLKLGDGLRINPWTDLWVPWIENGVPQLRQGVNATKWSCIAALRNGFEGGWNLDLLEQLCEPFSVEQILKVD